MRGRLFVVGYRGSPRVPGVAEDVSIEVGVFCLEAARLIGTGLGWGGFRAGEALHRAEFFHKERSATHEESP